jgi:hypothetical protein
VTGGTKNHPSERGIWAERPIQPRPPASDNRLTVANQSIHSIDEHLREDWLDAWIAEGLDAVETYLRNHAAFDSFLENRD